jgi:hypothetical protein
MSNIFNLPLVFPMTSYLPVSPYFYFSWPTFLPELPQVPAKPPAAPISSASTVLPLAAELIPSTEQKKKYKRTWKRSEVERLYNLTKEYCNSTQKSLESLTLSDFNIISKSTSQTPKQCMTKMVEIRNSGTLRSGVWSPEEDNKLVTLIQSEYKWGDIADILNIEFHSNLKLRNGKQCKERWNNHLNPEMNRGAWTNKEDLNLIEAHLKYGNKWSKISKLICFRTECSIKNRIKSLINKEKQELNNLDTPQAILERLAVKLRSKTFPTRINPRSIESTAEQPYKKKCMDMIPM